jgi:uncharacterized protein (TIGR00159 family)
MNENILNLFANLRIQDIFDILIIWVMASVLLIWFKQRASRFVFIGIGLLGIVYLTARFFQLYLTTVVLQGFFAIFLFVLVVIFQEDLRRFFEQLAMWGRLPRKFFDRQPEHEAAETIAQAVSSMARKHIGSLIVIQGEDPLDRHLSGGVSLKGSLSQPLLESIFDPHSPGHDGAVVIEGNRIMQFGCHLPLSRNVGGLDTLGLRHAAALGLSERCDALIVVVSEERGTIRIARGEELLECANTAALQAELNTFYAQKAPRRRERPVVQWFKENSREKVVALILSCILWFAFGYQKESIRRDFIVPVEYINLSSDWMIDKPKAADVKIMLMGPQQAFGLLNPETLKVSLDLSQIREGRNEIVLSSEMIRKPSNLTVVGIAPSQLVMTASRLIPTSLPVQVITEGRLPDGLTLQKISVTPAHVTGLVPAKVNPNGVRIRTEPVDLGKVTESTTVEAKLMIPSNVRFAGGKPPVVKITIRLVRSDRMSGG